MKLESLILSIIQATLDDWEVSPSWKTLRQGWASVARILNLDKLLWNYHRWVAKDNGIDITRWWWFQSLTLSKPNHGFVRDAVDILVDFSKAEVQRTYKASTILEDEYIEVLASFANFLSTNQG